MNKVLKVFLTGILVGSLSYYVYISSYGRRPDVLSENIEVEPSPIYFASPSLFPSPTETALPTNKPTSTPTLRPKPTPTIYVSPTPTPGVVAPENFEPLFKEYSQIYGVDENLLKKIADCETHFDNAVSSPPYAGMFQFREDTWQTYRNLMGKDSDINLRFGARESIETAAYVVSLGKLHLWPVCSK